MNLKTKLLKYNYLNALVYCGFLGIIAKLYSEIYILTGDYFVSAGFGFASSIFGGFGYIFLMMYAYQDVQKNQIKKIIKKYKIAVI